MLGEMQRISGKLGISKSDFESGIGVVTQDPWIQNTTLMENILFGKPFNSQRYHLVLEACALIDDINVFDKLFFQSYILLNCENYCIFKSVLH